MSREQLRYPFYLIVHPFNGYWEHKYHQSKRWNVILSLLILFLMVVTNILSSQYSGFVVNLFDPRNLNSIMEAVYVVLPVLFWCVANWSLTTLMDGEGKFVEIFTSTCFALIPFILIHLPWIWLSNFISLQETAFYHFFTTLAMLWFLGLLFVGNMTVHQFTPGKTIGTILLTVVAMGFMAFLCLLFFSLIQQMASFVTIIYQEIVLRKG